MEISKMRDPSIGKFQNEGKYTLLQFFLQEISSFYKCFSVLNWDSQFQNFIEEFQYLQCMSNIGLLITFHTATSGAICWPSSQAIPHFGKFYFEGSLVLEISILRDPSFWKFLFWGIPHFRNFGTGMKQTGFFLGVLPVFCIVFCFFTNNLYVKCSFCKNNRPIWHSLARGAPIVEFRHV